MLKEMQPERVCEDCGVSIRNRRADVKRGIDCRRKAQAEASRRIKAMEKEERIMNKVERSGIKGNIERDKTQQILKILKEGQGENPGEENKLPGTFGLSEEESSVNSFETGVQENKMGGLEIQQFKELIDEKIEESKKKEYQEKKKPFHTFQ